MEQENTFEESPLHHALFEAVCGGDCVAIEQLLAAGADANARDEKGNTPVLRLLEDKIELSVKDLDVLKVLAPRTDLSLKTAKGQTAWQIAHERKDLDAMPYLLHAPGIGVCERVRRRSALWGGRVGTLLAVSFFWSLFALALLLMGLLDEVARPLGRLLKGTKKTDS